MADTFSHSSLFKSSAINDDIKETAAPIHSVVAAVLPISKYPNTALLHNRTTGSRKFYRQPCPCFKDYSSRTTVYPPHLIRKIFRIPLNLYYVLRDELVEEKPLLRQRKYAFDIYQATHHTRNF